jgi:hypothetical protein
MAIFFSYYWLYSPLLFYDLMKKIATIQNEFYYSGVVTKSNGTMTIAFMKQLIILWKFKSSSHQVIKV